MTGVSGQYGQIQADGSTLVECTSWSLDANAALHAYASCSTNGVRQRVAGTKDYTGSAEGIFDPTDPIQGYIQEGDSVTLRLYVSATVYHEVPALVGQISQSVDVEDGEVERWTMSWEGNGPILYNQV